jgi:regulator of cell morphogenesis and NO signaling
MAYSNLSLAEIARENHRTVQVFEKYNLDFCCRGKKKLGEACIEKGLDVGGISAEIELAASQPDDRALQFTAMTIPQLVSHIIARHHFYVKMSLPLIMTHLDKVAGKHGETYPFMREVKDLFAEVQSDLLPHMQKEELVLFPRLVALDRNEGSQGDIISGPISVMENEHEEASRLLYKIRELTNNYAEPAGACTTFRVSLNELRDFEQDLHQHVHLENNILFPKASAIQSIQTYEQKN